MDYIDRIERLRQRMQQDGVELLVAASHARHSLDRPDYATHLSLFRSLGESLFLLFSSGEALLIASPRADAERAGQGVCVTDDLAAALAAAVAGRLSAPARVAVAGFAELPYRLTERLLAVLGTDTVAFERAIEAVCAPRLAAQLERAREAARIAECGYRQLLELARPGMSECQLAIEVNLVMKSLGADDNFLMLSALPFSKAVMPSSTRPLAVGDVILAELSPSYDGQFVQICRTAVLGEPSAELQEKYALVVRAMWAGIEAVRPGVAMSQVCAAVDRVLQEAGYGEYCRPPHIRRRGHGFGSGLVAPGDVAIDNQTILEEDMLFIIHPNQFLPETGYLLCGEPVRVTTSGFEVLTAEPARLYSIDA